MMTLPRQQLNWEEPEKNPLELLLPLPLHGRPSLLSYALPQLLIRIQNDFLDKNDFLGVGIL